MLRLSFTAFLAVLFSSCLSDPDCVITATNQVKISFLKTDPDKVNATLADTLIIDSIRVSGTDSVFYVADTVSAVSLPVDIGAYETTFFLYSQSLSDSVKFAYTRTIRVISPACGAFNYFQDLSLVLSTFTEVKITDKELSTNAETNVTIKR